ncbi:type II secretion system F family protein [Serinicoccus kebangsaanensis]|uniref:type II secretion system F family protein n=1 Tax=Serinicoccus kebangsaanensis TaxID=2602069 RepID=UPI00124DC83B|nr:type II secretion system F family protein [Serinicoccus kebangsaanensis]
MSSRELLLLAYPVGVLAVLLLAVRGWRMMRTTGLEAVEATYLPEESDANKPGIMLRLIDFLGTRFQRTLLQLSGRRRIDSLEQLLDRAGHPLGLSTRDFIRRQAGMTALGVVAFIFFALSGQWIIGVTTVVLLTIWMDIWIRGEARRRQQAIASELPDFLDVLAVTVSAGLSLRAALSRVAGNSKSALQQEIQRVLDDLQLGMSRREALVHLRERNEVEAIDSWVGAMLQAEELGAPLSDTLRDIAEEVRRARGAEVRRVAAKAMPKISLVVTTLIVPGALVLIVASLVIAQADTFANVFGG